MITLFACRINCIEDKEINGYLVCVSQEKRERLHRFLKEEDVRRSLLGELIVRKALMEKYGIPNNTIDIRLDRNRKPFIFALNGFYYNISHSNDWVICASGSKPVGADVEKKRQIDMDTAKYVFSSEEYETFINLGEAERQDHFFRLWTIKESFLKVSGSGLVGDLKSVKSSIWSGLVTKKTEDTAFFKNYCLDPSYWVTVCGYEKEFDPDVKFMRFQLSDFTN